MASGGSAGALYVGVGEALAGASGGGTHMLELTCPVCGVASPLEGFIQVEDQGRAVMIALGLPASLRDVFVRYMRLFNPPSRKGTISKTLRLLTELEQPIRDNRVSRRGNDYVAPVELWREAMEDIVERARQPGSTLTLPLKSHGYLFEVVAGKCEQAAAKAEKRSEGGRRYGDFYQAPQAASPIPPSPGPPQPQAKHEKKTMPDAVRQQLNQIKKGIP